ncbi:MULTISPECIES: hypothetical protein [Kamptonema]|uniref:hypothetical protein n=1 Tax=Kamptonema TaxID=1501433 RepID=UPI0002F061CB|nr:MULTISPECIES: hypothetical protein [Kamptonema]
MKCTIISQAILMLIVVVAPNMLLSLAAKHTSNCGGNEVKEMLLSSTTCPQTCYDSNGKYCCGQ